MTQRLLRQMPFFSDLCMFCILIKCPIVNHVLSYDKLLQMAARLLCNLSAVALQTPIRLKISADAAVRLLKLIYAFLFYVIFVLNTSGY